MKSVAALTLPGSLRTLLIVADNNSTSAWDDYIKSAVSILAMPVIHGHEPRRGYSNARNTSIDLALTTDAQVLMLINVRDGTFELAADRRRAYGDRQLLDHEWFPTIGLT